MSLLLNIFLTGSSKIVEDIIGEEEYGQLLLTLILIIFDVILDSLGTIDVLFEVLTQEHQHIIRSLNLVGNVDQEDKVVLLESFFIVCNTKSLLLMAFGIKLIEWSLYGSFTIFCFFVIM